MKNIKDGFHEVMNCVNKVSVASGVTAEMLKRKLDDAGENPGKLKKAVQESIKALEDSAGYAIEAGENIRKLKSRIYESLNIE